MSHWPALMTHLISIHMYVPYDQQGWVTGQHWPPQMSHDSGQSTLIKINYLAIHWWAIWPAVINYRSSIYLQMTSAITAKQHYNCSHKPCVVQNIFSLLDVIPWYRRDWYIWCYRSSGSSGCNASCLGQWCVPKARHHCLLNLSTVWKLKFVEKLSFTTLKM